MGKLLTTREAAEYLGFSHTTLNFWRSKSNISGVQKGPPHVKLGPKAVRYDEDDLAQWVEEKKANTRKETDHGHDN